MFDLWKLLFGCLMLSVSGLLVAAGWPRLMQGIRIESLHSIPVQLDSPQPLRSGRYKIAAAILTDTPSDDGEDLSLRARLLALGMSDPTSHLDQVRRASIVALHAAPANIEAWTTLCGAEALLPHRTAVDCLDHAFRLGAYDWYTAGRRMHLIEFEWPFLDEELRDGATNLVIPMWRSEYWIYNSPLRYVLRDMASSTNGRQLVRAGFASDLESLRSFNRWSIQVQIYGRGK